MKKILAFVIATLSLTSCLGLLLDATEENDNKQLYGSEWSTEDQSQGLKFYKDDSVLFFWTYGRGSGTFEYDSSTKYIEFTNFSMTAEGQTSEFPAAQILEDGTMKLYWHYLGKAENYYMILIKRR